ncbi:LOW QUALITY PROTEIN: Alpha/Beta hydrolase fold containing protein [Parasponia andersonii]|uniref:Alpha/Beta hydrolase fold containing protein n=1 Tax=Parasponia andersonii TaxID=3476 RepID=A0A2P5BZ12_PARAD|nr:LOW QUALITY PROTEIN: Alpha/Beta hydrolase fold containing protein [Parasponia andersonii]
MEHVTVHGAASNSPEIYWSQGHSSRHGHLKQLNDVGSFSDYVEPLIEFMASLLPEERVLLVGHSIRGACISLSMERFPHKISVGVYVTILMLGPLLDFPIVGQEVKILTLW